MVYFHPRPQPPSIVVMGAPKNRYGHALHINIHMHIHFHIHIHIHTHTHMHINMHMHMRMHRGLLMSEPPATLSCSKE